MKSSRRRCDRSTRQLYQIRNDGHVVFAGTDTVRVGETTSERATTWISPWFLPAVSHWQAKELAELPFLHIGPRTECRQLRVSADGETRPLVVGDAEKDVVVSRIFVTPSACHSWRATTRRHRRAARK